MGYLDVGSSRVEGGSLKRLIILSVSSVSLSLVFLQSSFLQPPSSSIRSASSCALPSPLLFNGEFSSHLTEPFLHCFGLNENPTDWPACDAVAGRVAGGKGPTLNRKCAHVAQPWAPAPYRRILLFLVDALRFQWLAHDPLLADHSSSDGQSLTFQGGPLSSEDVDSDVDRATPPPGNNNFAVAHYLLLHPAQKHHSRLFRVLCDVPTMTTQRLRALMSGNVPPFFDIAKSIAGTFTEQDSLLAQMHRWGRSVIALGDDTWSRLFKPYLSSYFIDGGFLITDYDTVDECIHQRVWKLLHMAKVRVTI